MHRERDTERDTGRDTEGERDGYGGREAEVGR